MTDANGENPGIYAERYQYTDFADFAPDPGERAAYVIPMGDRALFDPADFILWEHDRYAAVYPRAFAKEEQ